MAIQQSENYTDCALLVAAGGGIGLALAQQICKTLPDTTRIFLTCRDASEELLLLTSAYPNSRLVDGIDVLQIQSIEALCKVIMEQSLPLRWMINAAGVLHAETIAPERRLVDIDVAAMQQVLAVNTIGAAILLKHAYPLFPRQGELRVAMLSARVGSIADNRLGGWYSYRVSKAALNQLIRTAAIELRRHNKDSLCIGLHPGTVDTLLSRPFQTNVPAGQLFTPTFAAEKLWAIIQGRGAADSGYVFDWQNQQVPA